MKKRLPNVLMTTALLFGFCTQAVALNIMDSTSVPAADSSAVIGEVVQPIPAPNIIANGVSVTDRAAAIPLDGTTYVSVRTMVETLFPDAQVTWDGSKLVATASNLNLTAQPKDCYMMINGCQINVPGGVWFVCDRTLAPVRILGTALGASVDWNTETRDIMLKTVSAPVTAPAPAPAPAPAAAAASYSQDDLYWLSRIINAESGNQPLKGKIAVGTVILNRVESSKFPDTIKGVIFQRYNGSYQFSPVTNGSIYKEPNAESVKAAKMCLEGSREAGNSLFFNVAGMKSWAASNKSYVTTIADHAFYM